MSNKMPNSIRTKILETAKSAGWLPELKENGGDIYEKLITIRRNKDIICVDKNAGISKNGELKNLKAIVHPLSFDPSKLNASAGVSEWINKLSKKNWHKHSGFRYFEHESEGEPAGKAYKLIDIDAFSYLIR